MLKPRVQNEPIGQVVQDEAPGVEEKKPDGHVVQDASEVDPSAGQKVVAGQGRQADLRLLPGLGLYVPASQGVQDDAELAP